MDTNQKQPILTNTFGKGMNTDTSDALLGSDQYRLARNLRYTTNTEENTGELHMIDGVKLINTGNILSDQTIIKTAELRDLGIIISSVSSGWNVYTFHKNEPNNLKLVFGPCTESIGENISVVTKYESEEVLKLYIADGIHSIMTILLVLNTGIIPPTDILSIVSTPGIKLKVPKFCGLTSGQLKSGLVQYSYRLYKKYGQTSEISPTTKLILIINDASGDLSKDKQIKGGEYGKTCNCGVKISIDIENEDVSHYDSIIIYRIHYAQAGLVPIIENIADIKLNQFSGIFIDYGYTSNEIITLEEYNSHSGIHIIPAVIESKNDYLFAARIKSEINTLESEEFKNYDARAFSFNQYGKCKVQNASGEYTDLTGTEDFSLNIDRLPDITHDCINPRNNMNIDPTILSKDSTNADEDVNFAYKSNGILGGIGKHISWEFVTGNLIVDGDDKTPYITAKTQLYETEGVDRINPYEISDGNNTWWKNHVSNDADKGNYEDYMYGYANPFTSYLMKSLRRNELYRFGIIFYDKFGIPSSVKWIADIRTPDILESEPFTHSQHDATDTDSVDDLRAHPLGIKFTINQFPIGAVSYEIVRCNRQASDILNLQQGVLSRPQQRVYTRMSPATKQNTLTPTGFLTTTNYAIGSDYSSPRTNIHYASYDESQYSDNFYNNDIFQFVSAEALYNEDSILNYNTLKLDALKYIFPVHFNDRNSTDKDAFGLGLNSYSQHFSSLGDYAGMYNAYLWDTGSNFFQHYGISFFTGAEHMAGCYYKDIANGHVNWRYLNINGTYNYNTQDSTLNWFWYINNHYVYLKLYNFAENNIVYCQPHRGDYPYLLEYITDPDVDLSQGLLRLEHFTIDGSNYYLPVAAVLNAKHINYNIANITKANELKWNSLGKESDGTNNDNLQFVGQIVSIGDKQYCNFVSGPLYDSALTINDIIRDNNHPKEGGKKTTVPIGPAGRCLLLQISNHENEIVDISRRPPVCISERVNRLLDTIAASYGYTHYTEPMHIENSTQIFVNDDSATSSTGYTLERVYRALMMGTYICNIKHDVIPYGGNTYTDRQNNIYYSYGDIYDVSTSGNSEQIVFNGDTFLSPVEYISMHKCYDPNVINTLNACIIQSIPLETSINVAMTYGHEFSRNLTSQAVVNTQIEPANVYGKYIQTDPLYVYNTVYSASSLARMYSTIDYDIYTDSINNKDYRCYYSAPKGNNELQDSWLKFQPNNYIDVDTRYGAITQLRTFHNSLIYWQENATGLFSVNERTAITDDSNLPLILGTGGILSRYDYIATSNGMSKDDFSDALSESTLYWWDRNRNEICAYAGGQSILSMSKIKGVLNYLNTSTAVDGKPCLLYDKKYNEAIMRVTNNGEDESLVYSEYVAAFTSLYNIAFSNKIEFSDTTYITKDNNIFKLNTNTTDGYASGTNIVIESQESELPSLKQESILPYLKYVVNENPQIVKTFDNVAFGGRVYGGKVVDVNHLSFTFNTPLKQHSTTESDVITNREYDFKFAIPRNEAREPEESDQQWRSKFEERMKGKTMQCELSSDSNSTDFSLQYITTKFRQSWS